MPHIRLDPKEKAAILKAGEVPIKQCSDPKKSSIDKIRFSSLKTLNVIPRLDGFHSLKSFFDTCGSIYLQIVDYVTSFN